MNTIAKTFADEEKHFKKTNKKTFYWLSQIFCNVSVPTAQMSLESGCSINLSALRLLVSSPFIFLVNPSCRRLTNTHTCLPHKLLQHVSGVIEKLQQLKAAAKKK